MYAKQFYIHVYKDVYKHVYMYIYVPKTVFAGQLPTFVYPQDSRIIFSGARYANVALFTP